MFPPVPTYMRPHAPATHPPHAAGDDPQHISVVGEGTCSLFAIEAGNTLRPVPSMLARRESPSFSCHAWLIDNDAREQLVVGTRRGELVVVVDGEVRQTVQLDEVAGGVESIAAHSKVGHVGAAGRLVLAVDGALGHNSVLGSYGQPAGRLAGWQALHAQVRLRSLAGLGTRLGTHG